MRRRILLAGFAVTVLFLALFATGSHFAMSEMAKAGAGGMAPGGVAGAKAFLSLQASMMLILGLFVASLVGALIAAITSSITIKGSRS